ncbi:CGL53A [Auxenochlorella protothecoides x Auxenochlorella symbiontica]
MSLTNFWPAYGGLTQYAEWAGVGGGDPWKGEPQNRFFNSGPAQSRFKAYIQKLLNRTNQYRNLQYKNDPTILAWSIANEPRVKGEKDSNTLDRWIRDTSDFVRSQDSNHLITVDTEGFFTSDISGFRVGDLNPGLLMEGCNFLTNAAHPNIDFACCHIYHDLWNIESQNKKGLNPWTTMWLDAHLKACQDVLRKPLVLSEFSHTEVGTGDEKYDARRQYLQHVYGWLEKHMKNDNWVAGSCVWMICEKYYRERYDSEKRFIAIDGDGKDGLQEIISHVQAFNDSRSLHAEQ